MFHRPSQAFFYLQGSQPVLVFDDSDSAKEFQKLYKNAEIYDDPLQVFLPLPKGLESVRGCWQGSTAFLFHSSYEAVEWCKRLSGAGLMHHDSAEHKRMVIVGRNQHERCAKSC